MLNPTIRKIKKAMISLTTIVGPTGVPAMMEARIPIAVQVTDKIAEQIVTDLNDLKTRIALKAGKMIKADINNEPTRFIAKTMITAVIIAINKLYRLAFTPVALANDSSKVTAKILL